jgi:hypothetical protein
MSVFFIRRAERPCQKNLQTAFGRRHDAYHARIHFNGHAQGAAKGFKYCLGLMMRIVTF